MGRYLTPDSGDGSYNCRRLRFRAELAGYITGALELLTHPGAWEQFGSLTPDQVSELATEALNYYLESGEHCMIGSLWQGITENYPDGVLPLDGSTYSAAAYPELAAVLADTFDNGDGTFTLPDARGRVLIGAGAAPGLSAYLLGDTVGTEAVALALNELTPHDHLYDRAVLAETPVVSPGEVPVLAGLAPVTTSSTGAGDPHENRQPSLVIYRGVWFR